MAKKSRQFAEDTKVPVEKTRMEIEKMLREKGVEDTATAWTKRDGIVGFQHVGRVFRFSMPMPKLEEFGASAQARKLRRTDASAEKLQREAWERACRAKWRQILLIIKARLVAIDAGAETWEIAFLPYTVLPDGTVLGPRVSEELAKAYAGAAGRLPPMLPANTQQR